MTGHWKRVGLAAALVCGAVLTLWAQQNADVPALLSQALARDIAKNLIKSSELTLTEDKRGVVDASNTVKWGNLDQWYTLYDAAIGKGSSFQPGGFEKQKLVHEQVVAYFKTPGNVRKIYQAVKPALVEEIRAADKAEVVAAFLHRVQTVAKLLAANKLPPDLQQHVDKAEMAWDLGVCDIPEPKDKVCPKFMWENVRKEKASYLSAKAALDAASAKAGMPLQAVDFSAAMWLERRRTDAGAAGVKAWLDVAEDMMVTLNPALKPSAARKASPTKKEAAQKKPAQS